jgi:hypothetical protein
VRVVSVHQPNHEEHQLTGETTHDMKALAEMYLLSMADALSPTTQTASPPPRRLLQCPHLIYSNHKIHHGAPLAGGGLPPGPAYVDENNFVS